MKFTRAKLIRSPSYYLFLGARGSGTGGNFIEYWRYSVFSR